MSDTFLVHYVSEASQPYVRLDCNDEWHYVVVATDKERAEMGLPKDVHRSTGGGYTFMAHLVNCKACTEGDRWREEIKGNPVEAAQLFAARAAAALQHGLLGTVDALREQDNLARRSELIEALSYLHKSQEAQKYIMKRLKELEKK